MYLYVRDKPNSLISALDFWAKIKTKIEYAAVIPLFVASSSDEALALELSSWPDITLPSDACPEGAEFDIKFGSVAPPSLEVTRQPSKHGPGVRGRGGLFSALLRFSIRFRSAAGFILIARDTIDEVERRKSCNIQGGKFKQFLVPHNSHLLLDSIFS